MRKRIPALPKQPETSINDGVSALVDGRHFGQLSWKSMPFSIAANMVTAAVLNVAAEIEMTGKRRLIAVHTERVTIALPARLKRDVFDAAECLGVPASEFIRDAIAMAASSPRAA